MKLLRGLGELGTITLISLIITTSVLTAENASTGSDDSVVQQGDTREVKAVDADTIALAGALLNFALDLFDHKNAYDYIKEQFSNLYTAILERLPGFIIHPTIQTAENILTEAINAIETNS